MTLNLDQIEALADVLERVPRLTEIEVRTDGVSLRLRRGGTQDAVVVATPTSAADAEPVVSIAPETVSVRSGGVGVFHFAERVVAVGDLVREGQLLGQIETMRIDNDCKSPVAGRVVAVHVQDAQAVEYGQPLFVLEPEAAA